MALTVGTQLGSHEIIALVGKGGMGEVYRARDLKLNREVAIKILPEEFSGDADRVNRFQREAQVLASLNHPNIAQIYGLEDSTAQTCIVMELVEGETLAERLRRGRIPLDEALPIAKQIAEALEAAHEKGVIHRDLKPANIKVTPDRKVKVLDFGLAKAFQGQQTSLSNSPTLMSASVPGVILGTAAYMSPEQAKGIEANRASDIWAFGCVLYELLTGRAVFEGEIIGEVLAGIFKTEPDWSLLPADVPESIRRLLRRALQKDVALRLHDIADARIEIEDARKQQVTPMPGVAQARSVIGRQRLLWAVAIVLPLLIAAAAAPFVIGYYRLALNDVGTVRFFITQPPGAEFGIGTTAPYISISPNGRMLAFIAESNGVSRLWLRSLDSLEAHPINGTEGVSTAGSPAPFWSPD